MGLWAVHVTRGQRNEDVKPVLHGIHVVPHVNVTLNRFVIIFVPLNSIHLARLHCDAAKHHQQWKVRLIRDPELPVARYIDITHVASSFPGVPYCTPIDSSPLTLTPLSPLSSELGGLRLIYIPHVSCMALQPWQQSVFTTCPSIPPTRRLSLHRCIAIALIVGSMRAMAYYRQLSQCSAGLLRAS